MSNPTLSKYKCCGVIPHKNECGITGDPDICACGCVRCGEEFWCMEPGVRQNHLDEEER
jgi:hypothetical protein